MTSKARPGQDEPDTTAAAAESARIFQLEEEVGQLKEAVASHAVVDQAIGMLVALGHVTPDQGWEVLREVSQHANIKLRNVAEMILIWGRGGNLPDHVRVLLEDTLDRYGPTQLPEDPPSQ
ncbi:ANTAR domain-containing protein [Streptomyces sp. NPDC047022]|uniref:ANTAR domain-containing protein n=1 Tax=Streptomyces sp. NPDC047022 TaxID=3155737 RepID=UPI00340FBD17